MRKNGKKEAMDLKCNIQIDKHKLLILADSVYKDEQVHWTNQELVFGCIVKPSMMMVVMEVFW